MFLAFPGFTLGILIRYRHFNSILNFQFITENITSAVVLAIDFHNRLKHPLYLASCINGSGNAFPQLSNSGSVRTNYFLYRAWSIQ